MPERANYASFVHSDPACNSGRSLQPRGSNSSGNPIRHVRGFGVGRTRIQVHVNSNLAVLLTLLEWACRLARVKKVIYGSVATPGCASKL